jgi:hypothetical protein
MAREGRVSKAELYRRSFLHAQMRCKERFGFYLTKPYQKYAIKQIENGKAELVKKTNKNRFVYRLRLPRMKDPILAVYHRQLSVIVTVMPLEWGPEGDTEDDEASNCV